MTLFRRLLPWLFTVAVAANCWELATLTVLHWNGDLGIETPRTIASQTGTLPPGTEPFQLRADAVSGPALAAGFRVGDRLDARELYRANGYANPIPGVPYRLIAHSGTRTFAATIVPVEASLDPSQIVRLVAVFWLIGFASLKTRPRFDALRAKPHSLPMPKNSSIAPARRLSRIVRRRRPKL